VKEDSRPESDIQMLLAENLIATPIDIRALGQMDSSSIQDVCAELALNVNGEVLSKGV